MTQAVGTYGSLFTGIGGLDLAVERVFGADCLWQCEKDPDARRVLEKHWPGVPKHEDVRRLEVHEIECDLDDDCTCGVGVPRVDMIIGGFPCQGISDAGQKEGLDDERSALWFEFERIVGILRPQFVFVENVPAIRRRGLARVLAGLAAHGYDADWGTFPAWHAGAPLSQGSRFFLLAETYGKRSRCPLDSGSGEQTRPGFGRKGFPSRGLDPRQRWRHSVGWDDRESRVGRVSHGVATRVVRSRYRLIGNSANPVQAEYALRTLWGGA